MKKIFSIIIVLPLVVLSQQGIRFEDELSWQQILQKAKHQNKYIFVDCYATWCGPCKFMDREIYPNDTVGIFFNKNFVSVKVQMDTTKSDNDFIQAWYSDAKMLQLKYKIGSYPTYLFFSPRGEVMHIDVGAFDVANFVAIGKDALNPDKQYYTVLEKYTRNELDATHMKPLALQVKKVGGERQAHKIANDYINRLSLDALFTRDNIEFLYDFTYSTKDRGFEIFRDYSKRIGEMDKRFNEAVCKGLLLRIISDEEIKPNISLKNGKADWAKIKTILKKYGPLGDEAFRRSQPEIIFKTEIEPELKINPEWNHIVSLIQKQKLGKNAEFVVGSTVVYYLNAVNYYKTEKNCKNLVAAQTYYAYSFPTFLTSSTLNSWAWTVFKNSNDNSELQKALGWSKRSNELKSDTPEYLDTYANLLYKLGLIQEAIEWQKKAIDILKMQNNAGLIAAFSKTLEKMIKGEKTWEEKSL